MDKFQKQIATRFMRGLTTAQVILLIVSVSPWWESTVWGFVWLVGNSDYKPLYTGSGSRRRSEAYTGSDRSKYRVPPFQRRQQRSRFPRINSTSHAVAGGFAGSPRPADAWDLSSLTSPNWSGSDFSEKVNYQRALEAELERTIQTMNGVEQVRVHLYYCPTNRYSPNGNGPRKRRWF